MGGVFTNEGRRYKMRKRKYSFREKRAFIRGVLNTLNNLHWKAPIKDGETFPSSFSGYGCDVIHAKGIEGMIYFDSERERYRYTRRKEVKNDLHNSN